MNYFAHAYRFLDDPYFAAGTGVPDWLTVCDRAVRVRARHVEAAMPDLCGREAAVAAGARQHLRDDGRFHETACFVESVVVLAGMIRQVLPDDSTVRPGFLGHLLLELLLDSSLIADNPSLLDEYYRAMDRVDPLEVQEVVNRLAPRPTSRLAPFMHAFCKARILWDYLADATLLVRVNQVMRRVRLDPVPPAVADILPDARRLVAQRRELLLDGIPTPQPVAA